VDVISSDPNMLISTVDDYLSDAHQINLCRVYTFTCMLGGWSLQLPSHKCIDLIHNAQQIVPISWIYEV
jgi:hypothetical protein